MDGDFAAIQDLIRKSEGLQLESGKRYTTVAARVEALRKVTGAKYGIETTLLFYPGSVKEGPENTIVMRATVTDEKGRVIATGHAEETRGSTWINETSALENCETSAIGRALAALGISGGEFASTTEIDIADRKRAHAGGPATSAGSTGRSTASAARESSSATKASGASNSAGANTSRQTVPVDAAPAQDEAPTFNEDGTVSAANGWHTAVNAFAVFVRDCNDLKTLQSFWDRNSILIDQMKNDAPGAFDEVKEMFASRGKTLKSRK